MSCFFLLFISPTVNASVDKSDYFGENSRWSIDTSTRITHNIDKNSNAFMHVIGLDVHKVFSDKKYDIGTLTFQPYIVKLNNVKNAPLSFDDGNDTQLTWRIANFNYTALAQGKFNIKVGHFEAPFGLEYQIDTNGTLRQITSSDRGIKGDWGMSVNGILPVLEYEVALTRGSGNEIKSNGNPYIFSGRIGTPGHKNFVAGVSWFVGDVLGNNGVTQHKKIAFDTSYYYYQWQFIFELSNGKVSGNSTINTFAEVLWKNTTENFSTYLQLGYKNTEINREVSDKKVSKSYWVTGVRWSLSNTFDISAQYKNELKSTPLIDSVLSLQLRYRM